MNINGNFVTRFGNRLPVPYMEKIVVRDASFEIQISFYIKPPNLDEIDSGFYDEYLDSLNNLKVSIVTVADGIKESSIDARSGYSLESNPKEFKMKYGPVSIGPTGTMLFEHLSMNDINILQIATPTNKSYESAEDSGFITEQIMDYGELEFVSPNCSTVLYNEPLAISEYDREDLYNSQGELVYKYTRNITIVDEGTITDGEGTLDTVLQYVNAMIAGLTTRFVAFTTSLSEYPNNFTETQREQIMNSDPQAQLMFKQVSDLSYEQISADNAIKASEITIFKTTAGEHFDDDVLQSIDSAYYGNSELTNQDIINTFTDLIGTTSDEELQSKFDNLAYVLTVHGKSTDILVRLNEFRKTFVETSTATPVGRFHEKLEIRLYNANNAVKRGILVRKTLNVSPTVVDGRSTVAIPYEPPVINERYDFEKANNYIYTKSAKLGAYALPAGYSFSTEEAQAQADQFSEYYETAKDAENEAADLCQLAYDNIWQAIGDAFGDMIATADVNGLTTGIPFSLRPEEQQLNAFDYQSLAYTPNFKQPITFKAIGVGGLPLYIQRDDTGTGTAGDLDGDGVVTSLPTYLNIKLKAWPFRPSFYENAINEAGIVIKERGIYVPLTTNRFQESTREITALESQSKSQLYYNAGGLETENPNYFFEFSEYIELASLQSGNSRPVKIREVEKGIKTLGFRKEDIEWQSYIFDADENIREAIEEFKLAYKNYLEAIKLTIHAKSIVNGYAQLTALGGNAGVDLVYTRYNLYLNGFVFFDYEKALHRASNISKIFDVAKVEKLFGKELSHTYFKVIDSKIEKFYDASVDDDVEPEDLTSGGGSVPFVPADPLPVSGEFPTKLDSINPTAVPAFLALDSRYPEAPIRLGTLESYPHVGDITENPPGSNIKTEQYKRMAIALPDALKSTQPTAFGESIETSDSRGSRIGNHVEQPTWDMWAGDPADSNREFTYFLPRSFKFASPDAKHDYRLLCYEFQDVVGPYAVGAGADGYGQNVADSFGNMGGDFGSDYLFNQNQFGNSYIATINIEDNTKDMYVMIVRTFLQAKEEYEKYYQAIIEECSHNLSDERMNKFFIDGVIANYSSAPHLAPWYRVGLVYYTHLDLLTDAYGGSMENITQKAIDLSQRLHPANITLGEAESFRDKLQSMWETYYQPGTGTATTGVDDFEFNEIIEFGGMDSIDGYVAIMNDLPTPINLDYLGYSYITGDVVAVDTDDIL